MTISARDRRILLILLPIVILLAYWFLILSPKRSDLNDARAQRDQAVQARDQAVAQAAQLEKARTTFAADYASVVRLGKAIPETVDAPSLLVQLDRASRGTHIDFDSVTLGARTGGVAVATSSTQAPAQPAGNAAAGGAPAATAPGGAVENAGNAVTSANSATDTNVTTTATATTGAPASTTAPALDTVALTFNFTGSYFDLADFFHRLKRFVYVANNQIFVRGRLITVDTLSFAPGATGGGSGNQLTATVGATVYLSPKGQGVTGGATPGGPAGTTTQTTTTPAGSQTSSVPLATAGVR